LGVSHAQFINDQFESWLGRDSFPQRVGLLNEKSVELFKVSIGDIHHRESRVERTIQKLKTCEHISDHNRELLLDFKDFIQAQDLSLDRTCRYLYSWYQITEVVDFELDNPDKKDMVELVRKIHQDELRDDASKYQKMEWKKAIRKVYTDWMESRNPDFDGEELCDFFTLTVEKNNINPEELPKPRHIQKLICAADRTSHKALIAVTWRSMGRISEVLGLQWQDISFKDLKGSEMATVTFRDTKTGGSRTVPMREGYLYLKELQEKDKRSDEPEAFIFRGVRTDEQLSHSGACGIVRRARKKTDIPDKIKTNFHSMRKGKCIYYARQGVDYGTLCALGGWSISSSAVSRYLRIGREGKSSAVKDVYGLDKDAEEEMKDIAPVRCHNCQELSKFEAETCSGCDTTLKSSEMFKEVQKEKAEVELMESAVEQQTNWDEEEISSEADKIVRQRLGE
jgi:integrase